MWDIHLFFVPVGTPQVGIATTTVSDDPFNAPLDKGQSMLSAGEWTTPTGLPGEPHPFYRLQ